MEITPPFYNAPKRKGFEKSASGSETSEFTVRDRPRWIGKPEVVGRSVGQSARQTAVS